ncbi:Sulfotransferase 1C4 [Bulinus truncatus]|nr:Sulfotransferase 1C4 [Bulinus truncatus]
MRKHLFSAICFIDSKSIYSFSSTESPRLLVTHVPFRHIPKQALEKKIKIIYLDRNPKDVLVSYYNHMHKHVAPLNYPGTFEHFFHLSLEVGYLYGNIFDYAMEWQNGRDKYTEVNFFISVYEDMKSDPVGGVKKLNTYLGTGCSDQLCEQIAQVSCFDNVKSHRDANTPAMFEALFVDNKLGIYRKGEVGDWKNWFTVAMNEEFEEEYKKRMSEYRTVYKYSL